MADLVDLVPPGSWDTHIHVFDPKNFPYAPKRPYTPKEVQLSEYPTETTGCKNIVVVHASMQGSSPAALVDTLSKQSDAAFAGYPLRGLMTLDPSSITDAEIDELHRVGVRGARFHKMSWGHGAQGGGSEIFDEIQAVADRIARLGWIIDIFCPLAAWAAMADNIRSLDPRLRVVADHFGGAFPGDENTDDFHVFLSLVREKRVFVKLSGFERLYHGHAEGMDALEPLTKALIEAGPTQIVYGSDWPHTQLGVSRQGKSDEQRLNEVEGFRDVDDAGHIRKLREWIPDDEVWRMLFVDNPDRLFR